MKTTISKIPQLILNLFNTKYLVIYLFAILGTAVCVYSGFDWWYLLFVSNTVPMPVLFIADILGFVIPISLLLYLFCLKKNRQYFGTYVTSILLALGGTVVVKAFSGRESPPHEHGFVSQGDPSMWIDNSHNFNFGFMQEQIVGGFPSSHAAVVFAIAFTTLYLFPAKKKLQLLTFLLALFVALGVTFGFHWFSEFLVGAILGYITANSSCIQTNKK
jgi:membrane-associated phospholipid phosphatase